MPAATGNAPRTRPAPLRADAARNRAQVLEAARHELTVGNLALPMNLIARAAGVGVGTVYRHFPTRQSLLEALAQDSLQRIVRETEAAATDPDPAAGLQRTLRCALRCQLDDLALAEILATPTFECIDTLELGEHLVRAVSDLLARARDAGVLREDVTPDDFRRLMSGIHHALRAGPDPEARVEPYLRVLLNGLRP